MYKHILLPTDGSALSAKAVRQGIRLAKALAAKITAMNVTPGYPYVALEDASSRIPESVKRRYYEEAAAASSQMLDKVAKAARAAGVQCKSVSVQSPTPYQAIINHAKKANCDLIFMASHGRGGLSALLLGSETNKVLTHSTIPVLVVR